MPNAFTALLRQHQRFLLTGHENPDGDCLGAQCALLHLLRALGKEVHIVNPDPIGRNYAFLTRHTPFASARANEPLPPVDVVVLLDCAQLQRTGALGPRLRATGAVLTVIDHHVGSEHGDGSVSFVDSKAPATGALVHRLYGELAVPLSPAAAEGVFVSLVADTGWFRHSNTDAAVLELAALLVRDGVDPSALYDRMYRRMHPDSARLLGEALGLSQLRLHGRLAVVCLDKALMERAARADFDTDLVLEPLRSLEGIEVVAVFKERFDGAVKLSLRAKKDIDVQRIAASFGGGGHKKAAGASMPLPMAESVKAVEALVQSALAAEGRG
ncbi:MAG TPA: DHH family phosphoesterase [Planctomycetota bacterium]|nr:DHH family phosphoesterase [Planctomycetota bacterium]